MFALTLAFLYFPTLTSAQVFTESTSITIPKKKAKVVKKAKTPFDIELLKAVKAQNFDQAKKALEKGASVDAQDEDGNTSLIIATNAESVDLVSLLIKHNADIQIRNNRNRSALSEFFFKQKMPIFIQEDNASGKYPLNPVIELLILAAQTLPKEEKEQFALEVIFLGGRDSRILELVLGLGIDPNIKLDMQGNTLLTNGWFTTPNMVKKLISYGVDPNIPNNAGETPLMAASSFFGSMFSFSEVIEVLVSAGAQIDAVDNQGSSSLLKAIKNNRIPLAVKLIEKGANVNLANSKGQNPFMLAMEKENPELIKALIKAGIDLNITNEEGRTPLMMLALVGKNELVQAFIEAGADINKQDVLGQTALMLAIDKYPYPETVKILVKAGADVSIQDQNGDTAISIADRDGRKEIVELLKQPVTDQK
jgi:uncharacterized protein